MKRIFYLPWAFAAIAVRPAEAMAADHQPDSLSSIQLREIVISANRALPSTPVAMSRVGIEEIGKRNDGRDIPYLISMTPSVVITSDAGGGIGYSGIRVRGSDPSRINVMANGVPINDSESHSVYWVNMPDLASSLRDIQIQRGAGTSVNGAGAFGASLNMATAAPSRNPGGRVVVGYGSYNTHRETLSASSGLLGKHWTLDGRISNIGSDGYIDRASSKLWSYQGQVGFQSENTNIRLLAFGGNEQTYMAWDYASKEEMEKYGRRYNPCGKYTNSDGEIAYYPDQKDYFTQHHLQLHIRERLGNDWLLNATLFYTKGDGHYEQLKTKRTLVEYGLTPFTDSEGKKIEKSDLVRLKYNDNDFGGGNISANYRHGIVDAVAGTSLNYFNGDHFGRIQWVRNYMGPINPLQKYYDNTGRKLDFSIFGRANVDLGSWFTAFGDIQYRHINYRINGVSDNYDWNTSSMAPLDIHKLYDFLNPKIGLSFYDGHASRAFASWSVAHREPVRDNFTDGDRRHDPRPERMFDYEVGYSFTLPWISAGVNLYYMDYKDQLVLTGQLSDTGNPLSVNAPSSYRAGVEVQFALRPVKWFEWQVNATFSRNRIKRFTEYIYEDEWKNPIENYIGSTPIAFSPSVTANNAFTFTFSGFEAMLTTHYVSRQYLSNAHSSEQMLDPYCVSDLNLSYCFGNLAGLKNLTLGLAVNNIFNAKYESNGYAGAGYYVDDAGKKVIYRYAGYAAQATTNVMATLSLNF